jgi:dTDP-4-amino-4,6-dideoxygalactose transaminase
MVLDRLKGGATEPAHVNARLSNLDGAIAMDQFERLHRHAAERRRNAEVLLRRLSMLQGESVTNFSSSAIPVKLVYLLPNGGLSVQEAIEILSEHGIEAEGGYAPLHASYADDARFPNTTAAWRRVLCLPLERPTTRSIPIPFHQTESRSAAIPRSASSVTALT